MGGLLALGVASGILNQIATRTSQNYSFRLNERAAQNADKRTRALFHDLYSPQAQVANLEAAGLSPGLMYAKGGAGGAGGAAGAQAAPANAQQISMLDLANLKLMEAQIKNINADTENKKTDTEGKAKGIEKTDAEISKLLEDLNLTKAKVAYQELVNKMTQYDLRFKGETIETDIEQRKVELAKMVEDYRTAMANAGSAEIELEIKQSTAGAKIRQEVQQVMLNDLELLNKKLNLELTQEQINKVKEEVVEKRLSNAWIDIRNEEDIAKLRHDIQMDLYNLDIKDREQNYQMTKGILDSLLSLIKPMKIK